MATPVEVPKLGNTVEECIVAQWRKRMGDAVSAGDVVAEIETDKATFEVTSPVDGVVLATFFDEGALVPVFTNLFVVGVAGEDVSAFVPAMVEHVAPAVLPPVGLKTSPAARPPAPPAAVTGAPYSPRARRFAEERNYHPTAVAGSGPGGRVLEEDLRAAYYGAAPVGQRAAAAAAPAPA